MEPFTRFREAVAGTGQGSVTLSGAISGLDRVHALAAVLALGLTLFLAFEPTENWILLLLSGLAAVGTDIVVRAHPKAHFQRLDDTALHLFVPVLFVLAAGLFLEEVVANDWTIALGALSIVPFWLILWAEQESVDHASDMYHWARGVLNLATYLTAFLFFATLYDFDLNLQTTAFASGIVSLLLAIEVLREEAMDSTRTIVYALAIGLLLGEAAWATHFLPLEGSAAAVFLLLALYLMTGMMHNYLAERLNPRIAGEFVAISAAGLLVVAISQAYI